MTAARAEILRFWRSVELFSPQRVPAVDRREHVYHLDGRSPAPWEPAHPLARERLGAGRRWRHTVYCGVFACDAAFEVLRAVMPTDPESFDERFAAGDSALLALVVSDSGRPLPNSEVLSSCAWAIGRAIAPGPGVPGWLDGLAGAEGAVRELLERSTGDAAVPDDAPPADAPAGQDPFPLTTDDLLEWTQAVVELLGVERLAVSAVRVHSRAVAARHADRVDDHDFLNSFIADDLARVASNVRRGNLGNALRTYLAAQGEIDVDARIDVAHRLDVVHAAVAPRRIPLGRWPAQAEHLLGLSQQLAVSATIGELGEGSGMFAVNGPPGTGKTTMLREVVADVVVERARQLATLSDPADAFTAKHRWKVGDYTRVVHELQPKLTGFEMVVACATNAAAENISIEIPGIDAIDPGRRAEIDYFPQLASRLLDARRSDAPAAELSGWALIAGCLGNKDNRQRFANALWHTPRAAAPDRPLRATDATDAASPPQIGLRDILKGYEAAASGPSWAEAVAAFDAALGIAEEHAAERARVFDLLGESEAAELRFDECRKAAASAPGELDVARRLRDEQEPIAAARRDECTQRTEARRDHGEFRPRLLESLLPAGRARRRDWYARDRELADMVAATDAEALRAQTELEDLRGRVATAERACRELETAATTAERQAQDLRMALGAARDRYGTAVPDEQWWQERGRRERTAPWIDGAWNAARTDLFLAALRLHQAFVMACPTQMRQSLQGAIDVLTGSAPDDVAPEAALAAWRSLFLVVPVLSSSFASFARVFSHLGRESLGWLFVDEAGQCVAQAPAGAIWRSRRVLVVGDPLQLEPVVTLPLSVQQAIRREHGVEETWLPSRCSAQTLADRGGRLGTLRGAGDEAIWLGAPLNVHRRCDEPIFSIVNDIAYEGRIVDATPDRPPLGLPPSAWLDVASVHADGHWIPAEGERLDSVLERLSRQGQDFGEVFVLTPFRHVAGRLSARRRRYPGLTTGTVHTAQGREADIVILVLGGEPGRPGAKRWAAAKPNLLNVAVSRAKRRLYVIGDRRAWSPLPHFDVLADRLPTH